MMTPIRCFSCGALIGDKFAEFQRRVGAGEEPAGVLDEMGLKRYCCRRMLLSSIDVTDQIIPYFESLAERRTEFESEST